MALGSNLTIGNLQATPNIRPVISPRILCQIENILPRGQPTQAQLEKKNSNLFQTQEIGVFFKVGKNNCIFFLYLSNHAKSENSGFWL